jgi:hypothetical protein
LTVSVETIRLEAMSRPSLIDVVRLIVKISLVCFLASLVSPIAYGQDLALDGDVNTRVARFFGPELRLNQPTGLMPLTTLDSPFQHPSRVPVTTVAWSAASMNTTTAVVPPATASLSTHRKRTTTLRVVAGLLGAGLAGVGAYLLSTSEGSSRIEICTLCSEPPANSQAHLQLTGRQGAGIASIALGGGLLIYAVIP